MQQVILFNHHSINDLIWFPFANSFIGSEDILMEIVANYGPVVVSKPTPFLFLNNINNCGFKHPLGRSECSTMATFPEWNHST